MKTPNQLIGQYGEEIACSYLVEHGYKILNRNFRTKFGEVDIIAQNHHKCLCFIEVKTIKELNCQGLMPEDQLSTHKLNSLKKICSVYANSNPNLTKKGWQIDLIAITIPEFSKIPKITLYENITN